MSSILAMMFLVIFGSLTAAMAVVAQGNLRTADSAMKVSRAMSAAETGLVFAARRLATESSRFVVEKGVIDDNFGHDLWRGTYNVATDGAVEVLPPVGYIEAIDPLGVVDAVRNAHLADSHDITPEPGDAALPEIDMFDTLRVRPIALTTNPDGTPSKNGPYFRVKYELIVNAPYLRVTSQGVDGNITRTLQMDFRIDKKIEFAIISPNRIMIGKNVRIEGPLGSRYGVNPDGTPNPAELGTANGDPLVMRSDFYFLDAVLDVNLDTFFTQVAAFDVDGDGRLRPDHPIEIQGINAAPGVLVDYDLDQYVDDFDLFLAQFDANADRRVVLADEFLGIDDQLFRLIDEAYPDRDGDGVPGTATDIALGYNDGVIDANDLYAKVHGRLAFAVARAAWEAANGASYQTIVHGPVRPGLDQAPAIFEADEEELRELNTDMFTNAQTWFNAQALATFQLQVDAQIGLGVPPATYTDPSDATWEDVPFGAQAAGGAPYDYYQRPIYDNMTFTNVRIPIGNNGLFRDCTFIGVTYIETDVDCIHENWNYKGALEWNDDNGDQVITTDEMSLKPSYDAMLPPTNGAGTWPDTRVRSNNVRFDGCTFIGSVTGDKPNEYAHWRNKIQFTGATRFYIDPNDPDLLQEIAGGNPDAQGWQDAILGMVPDDIEELEKSSILMPGWSADVGNFTNEQDVDPTLTPKVKLKGTIVAGILDVRGTADVHGTLLMTFRPQAGVGPLFYGGLTDAFNTTIGYFGPSDGDGEGVDTADASFVGFGEITLRYDPDAKLPDGIPWPISISADPFTYTEGGSM
ncbi:MAG: hypothetical protein IH983_06570 [Planctomycetes bacterium]|nr:hypothetical protein [Planctomycetota bacterium]